MALMAPTNVCGQKHSLREIVPGAPTGFCLVICVRCGQDGGRFVLRRRAHEHQPDSDAEPPSTRVDGMGRVVKAAIRVLFETRWRRQRTGAKSNG